METESMNMLIEGAAKGITGFILVLMMVVIILGNYDDNDHNKFAG
jgi:hypothetical protein